MDTKVNAVIGIIASIRENSNKFIERELSMNGIPELLPPHGSILACLYRAEGGLQVLEIAEKTGRSKSSVSELVDRLATLGYVTKSRKGEDKRTVSVELTEKGRAIRGQFTKISERLVDKAYEGFSEAEKEALVELLERMKINFIQA